MKRKKSAVVVLAVLVALSLILGTLANAAASSGNLLSNGDFEAGLTGWTQWGGSWSINPTAGIGGSKAATVDYGTTRVELNSEWIDAYAGQVFDLEGYVRDAGCTTGARVKLDVIFRRSSESFISRASTGWTDVGGEFEKLSVSDITSPGDTRWAVVELYGEGQSPPHNGGWLWDNIVLQRVAGPDSQDDGYLEVGVEWVNDYPTGFLDCIIGTDLSRSDDSTAYLALWLQLCGWSLEFNNPPDGDDGDAWEKHFKAVSKGGWDYLYADNVDLVMFQGHGDAGVLLFGGSSEDDQELYYHEAFWGDKDLEWILLCACKTLKYDDSDPPDKSSGRFAQALLGAHVICGAKGSPHDVNAGYHIGGYLWSGYSIMEAWFYGNEEADYDCTFRVIAEDSQYLWEQVWGCGTTFADPVRDNYYFSADYEVN